MLRLPALCCAFLLALPALAAAEWHLAPMTGVTFHGSTTILDLEQGADRTHLQVGGAAALVGDGLFGVEAITVFTPSFFRGEDRTLLKHGRTFALMGNAVLTMPKRLTEYSLRPFVSGGFGVMSSSIQNQLLPVKSDLPGYNVGVGAVGFLSDRVGLRFDLRSYRSLHRPYQGPVSIGPVRLSYATASIGIVFRR